MAPLTEDHIDDILYLARIGDVTELLVLLTELREAGITTLSGGNTNEEYILAAKDEDGNTAMHMASANGHTGMYSPPLLPPPLLPPPLLFHVLHATFFFFWNYRF